MLKAFTRSPAIQAFIGKLLGGYLRFVRATTRFELEPADLVELLKADTPFICTMWHGQNFMLPLLMWKGAPVSVMITRHGDGDAIAVACAEMGIKPIRASGGDGKKTQQKGGAAGLRAMLKTLDGGEIVVMTPDMPKIARVAGAGIIALARLSGRPIYPVVVATSRRIDLKNWDRTSICLPFGRGVIKLGEPIYVARDADEMAQEVARRSVELSLDALHDAAYAKLGTVDPGAVLKAKHR